MFLKKLYTQTNIYSQKICNNRNIKFSHSQSIRDFDVVPWKSAAGLIRTLKYLHRWKVVFVSEKRHQTFLISRAA